MSRISRRVVMLSAITALALALRVDGLQWGLPALYNMDEISIMARALSFAKGTLNPGNFLYPTFYFYVLFGWVGVYLGMVWLTGGVSSIAALQQLYFTDVTGIFTAGRLLTAVCGALTVPAVYRFGSRLFDARTGIAAALFLAVAPTAIRDSHYVKHDIPVTLVMVIAMIAISRVWPADRTGDTPIRAVMLAGAACGVAFSTHYYSIFLALPLGWAILQRWRASGWRMVGRQLAVAAIVSAAVFFALSPFILFEPTVALRDILANRGIVIDRAVHTGAFANAERYVDLLWADSIGKAVVLLGLAGAVWLIAVAPARGILLLLFPVTFFFFITNTTAASRYLNPILPFLAVFAAWTIWRVAERFATPRAAAWLVILGCAAPPFISSVRSNAFFKTDDTRTLAQEFIERTIPPGATVLVQPYSVALTPSRESLVEALTRNLGGAEAASTKFRIQLSLDPYPEPAYRLIWLGRGGLDAEKIYVDPAELALADGWSALRQLGVTYVILKRYNHLEPELESFAAELSRRGRLIAAFSPYRATASDVDRQRSEPFLHNTDGLIVDALERPGPPLEIWQLNGPDS